MKVKIPVIGMRIIKSALGVLLCFVIYLLRGRQGIPFYSAVAVLWCMQPYTESTKTMARQRIVGTLIGAFYGLLVILFELYVIPIHNTLSGYVLVSAMIIVVLYTTAALNKKNASYFSCVVFLSITITHITDSNPYLFVLNRILDTMIGIVLGMLVNKIRIPRKKKDDILFVSGLDDTLLTNGDTLTPYSKVQLNRMIESGAKFTISTMRTPASLMQPLRDVHLNLPIVVMDGAALYNIKEKQFIRSYVMSKEISREIMDLLDEEGFHYFINTILDDILMIYYGEFHNPVEETIYKQLRVSPYRNYISKKYYRGEEVVYFMLVEKKEKMESLYQKMMEKGYVDKLKILFYDSKEQQGYSYMKIYNKNASKENMLEYLKESIGITNTVTFGSIENRYDITITDHDANKVVKTMEGIYEPFFWKKTEK
ncbi:MAG: FUSC family protein [Lachnospiraceae bacterium]|nr:FUSC family protein [Lachnospiraceae bacterium]